MDLNSLLNSFPNPIHSCRDLLMCYPHTVSTCLLCPDAPRIHHLPRRVVLLEGAEWTLNCSVEAEPPALVRWSKFALTNAERAGLPATLASISAAASAAVRPESTSASSVSVQSSMPSVRANELLELMNPDADGGNSTASDQEDSSAPASATSVVLHMDRSLHLQPAQRSDAGHYACVANNALGSATSSHVLILVASKLSSSCKIINNQINDNICNIYSYLYE